MEGNPERSIDELSTDYETFHNYSGVDDDATATIEMEKHLRLKRLKAFDTVEGSCVTKHIFYKYFSVIKSTSLACVVCVRR